MDVKNVNTTTIMVIIFILIDNLANLSFATSETSVIISNNDDIYELSYKLHSNLILKILGTEETSGKS